MLKRSLILMTIISLALLGLAACGTPSLGGATPAQPLTPAISSPATAAPTVVSPTPTAAPTLASPTPSGVSSADTSAIRSVIQKANQEQVQAVTAHDPTIMQDTATASYYQQSVQALSDLLNSGVTAIRLVDLQWGSITLQGATTAQAMTTETWSTSFADGGTLKESDPNTYTLVLQDGAWKVQDDQHPDASAQQTNSSGAGGATNSPTPVAPIIPSTSDPQSQSRNWSGYAATGGSFTSVSSKWTVPNVSADTPGVDATWVGIGGVNSTDLIQAGTESDVTGGQVSYSAWWETLPQPAQQIPMTIHAGDLIGVSIVQQKDGTFLISINDATNDQSWQKNVSYKSSLSSAEWVEEAPMVGRRTLAPLDQFGSVTFVNATTTENGKTRTIAQAGGQPITMNSGGGQALAQTSALAGNGDSFSVVRTDVQSPSRLPARTN